MSRPTTKNAFLGGKLWILQPVGGYRAGVDPVLLAASVPAEPGQSVLELGCGVGTAFLCLSRRVGGLTCHAVEIQPDYAQLARENLALNKMTGEIHDADLSDMPLAVRQLQFDHVIANPPYFDPLASTAPQDRGRGIAMGEETPLDKWVEVAARRLAPKGLASFIYRAERLPDLMAAMASHLGSLRVLPLQARTGRDAGLVIIRGQKAGRAAFKLHAPVAMHVGEKHLDDREDYTDQIRNVLRHGAALSFPK